jgi:hypothetical protein
VALAALVCLIAGALLLVRLHVAPTGLSPIRDAVSDYGTTPWHVRYRAMAVALGASAGLLALALADRTDARHLLWLWVFAACRIAIAGFMTDRDPPPFTRTGRVHYALAAAAFASIALATTTIDWTGDPGALGPIGIAVAVAAVATLLTRIAVPAVFGLAERLLYVATIAWLAVAAISLLR